MTKKLPTKLTKLKSKDLIEMALSLHDSIYSSECFSSGDYTRYNIAISILQDRGYTVDEERQLSIKK